MPQFDVYPNPGRKTRDSFPFLVDIQSSLISDLATRIVIPLGKFSHFKHEQMKGLTPVIEYADEKLLLLIPQISSVPASILKQAVGSLEHFRDEIIAALDFAITGY